MTYRPYDKGTIKNHIRTMQVIVLFPVVIMIAFLIYMMNWQNAQYSQIISNLTMATNFNFDFKTNIDYKMYRIVIGADTVEDLNPYEDLENSRQLFTELRDSKTQDSSVKGLNGLLILIDLLENQIRNIENSSIYQDYDKNFRSLEYDIYVTTDLIEESMANYIYNETKALEELRHKLNVQVEQLIVLGIACAVFVLLFMMFSFSVFSRRITVPLEELCRHTKKLAGGTLESDAPQSDITEIQVLSDQYDNMVVRIRELIENIKKEQEHQRQTELQLLQSQINPHFLYNTLDAIVWLAEGRQHEKVVQMITALSSFLRIGLNKGHDFIRISEEAEHVRSYLEIQHFRYEDILDYEIEIDPAISGYYILKLMLQPLVENALYHGIKSRRDRGFLRVSGWQERGVVIFQVEDNGIGMKPDKLEQVRRLVSAESDETAIREQEQRIARAGKPEQTGRHEESFGMANVAERIRLNYGPEYGLLIESEYGTGTVVTLRLPAQTNPQTNLQE